MDVRRSLRILVVLIAAFAAFTQQVLAQRPAGSDGPSDNRIDLNVVVTCKAGSPVSGLKQQDFTILDNKVPQKVTSFQALDGTQAPIEVTIVIDAVNGGYQRIAYERDEIDQFLRADRGDLRYPMSIVVLTDTGLENVADFSKNGNNLSSALDKYHVSLPILRRIDWRFSLDELHELALLEARLPGRKMMLWISPGWPLFYGPEIDERGQREFFGGIASLSTELRRDRITLYNIDPAGTTDSMVRDTHWEDYVDGVTKPGQAQPGNLALQVLTTQSGGLVFSFNNDITSLLERCLADTRASYDFSFEPQVGAQPNEYHHLEIRIAKRGLKARTWQGYYSQPVSQWQEPAIPPPAGPGLRTALR